jgi:3-isopropylmalate dehydrogenase
MQESVNTAFGVGRVLRQAFGYAAARPRRKLTLVHKTNVLAHAGDLWRRTFEATAAEFGGVTTDYCHVGEVRSDMLSVSKQLTFGVRHGQSLQRSFTALRRRDRRSISPGSERASTERRTEHFEPVRLCKISREREADPTAGILSAASSVTI